MPSFEKIDYFLRPSKQVERKLIIEALQKMAKAGHYIHDYTYLGLGSIFYVDFLLFHKYLLIDNMICAEHFNNPNRMKFNKPYEFIELKMKPIGEIIPVINREKPYLIWLDYDYTIGADVLSDIRKSLHVMSPGSILIITIACDFHDLTNLINPVEKKEMNEREQQHEVVSILNELIGAHYSEDITLTDIATANLPKLMATVLRNFINSCMVARSNLEFIQLFNFQYKDGIQMLTLGGIVGNEQTHDLLEAAGIYKLKFVTASDQPIEISVPPLTIREKNWLENNLTRLEKHLGIDTNLPKDVPFEIKADFVRTFVKYYRHYPSYYETLV
jgi:hypothetical protein